MWLIPGIGAMIAAAIGVILGIGGRDAKWPRHISMALTALTLCAYLTKANEWVLREDWSALMDTTAIPNIMWGLTIASVILNGITQFGKKRD